MLLPWAGGCTLIDQRTFRARPAAAATPAGPAPALMTIDFERPDPVYDMPLRQAVDLALSRKPGVAFDVVTVVPATGTPAQQADAAGSIRGDARDVARIIVEQGVDVDRVSLLARSEPGVTGRQVRVYVR